MGGAPRVDLEQENSWAGRRIGPNGKIEGSLYGQRSGSLRGWGMVRGMGRRGQREMGKERGEKVKRTEEFGEVSM